MEKLGKNCWRGHPLLNLCTSNWQENFLDAWFMVIRAWRISYITQLQVQIQLNQYRTNGFFYILHQHYFKYVYGWGMYHCIAAKNTTGWSVRYLLSGQHQACHRNPNERCALTWNNECLVSNSFYDKSIYYWQREMFALKARPLKSEELYCC